MTEIVFFDLETTIPPTDIIEFGAIVLDKIGLYEKDTYSTMIHSDKITQQSIDCNGISLDMLNDSPSFNDVADNIYNILHNRIWAGHNIIRFDIPCIDTAFQQIGRQPPQYIGVIDTLPLIQNYFGKRAGDFKMATLGNYFGLGEERHRAIDDCRMTIDVLKNCSMTIFLEEHAGCDGFSKPSKSSGYTNEIIEKLHEALQNKLDIWISYNGGANPLVPRKITPVRWVHEPWLVEAFCHQAGKTKNFSQKKIVEIRPEQWQQTEQT